MTCPKCGIEAGNQRICPCCGGTIYLQDSSLEQESRRRGPQKISAEADPAPAGKASRRKSGQDMKLDLLIAVAIGNFFLNLLLVAAVLLLLRG